MNTMLLFATLAQWISVMPLNEGGAEAIAEQSAQLAEETHVDGIVFSCPIRPAGRPLSDKASLFVPRYRAAEKLIRARSKVAVGILLQATMGHSGPVDPDVDFQTVVKPDGTTFNRICPLDRGFLDYIAGQARKLGEVNPDFFMVDDDTRMTNGADAPCGCFCPLHLAELKARTGRSFGREELVKALAEGKDAELARVWSEIYRDSLLGLYRVIRAGFGPSVSGELCICASKGHIEHSLEFAKALAAPGEKPAIRGSGAPYHGFGRNPFYIVDLRPSYARQLEFFRDADVVYMQEHDTCPHTLWACSAVRQYDHMVMLALDGLKGAKMWLTRTSCNHERRSADAYRRIFRENRGIMEWAAKRDFRERGVVIPPMRSTAEHPEKPEGDFAARYLSLIGVPVRYGWPRAGETAALTAETARQLPPERIREFLRGRMILDGEAAKYLQEHGFAAELGVVVSDWEGRAPTGQEMEDGTCQPGIARAPGYYRLSGFEGVGRELTKLYRVPRMGEAREYAAPGSVLVKTKAGGELIVLAQALTTRDTYYYNACFWSETYQKQMVRWLAHLAGGLPGGAVYTGVGSTQLLAGDTAEDGFVIVLNQLSADDIDEPAFRFDRTPTGMERLGPDGRWRAVPFSVAADGEVKVQGEVRPQRPAVFRPRWISNSGI